MNLLESSDEPSAKVLFVNFNQDCTALAVGKKGFKLYSLNLTDDLEMTHENTEEDIRIVERLFSSNLVAIVTMSAPRKLKVCHSKKIKVWSDICDYNYPNSILAVKLNRSRLVVCLEKTLYIHNIRDMKVLHTIWYTSSNPSGLCVLSANTDKLASCYLAYPGCSVIGKVQIFDAINLQAKSLIRAHDSPLAAMAFAPTGTKLATASRKGTVIRVFDVLNGTKLYEFRWEIERFVKIYYLSFSDDSAFLSASTNTETVHIFKLDEHNDVNSSKDQHLNWIGYFSEALKQSVSNLSSQESYIFSQGRSFATVHLPISGARNICAIARIQNVPRVLVVSHDGVLYVHNLDPLKGGDCTLVCMHNLIDSNEESGICEIIDSNVPESNPPSAQQQDPNVRRNMQTDPVACPPAISTDD